MAKRSKAVNSKVSSTYGTNVSLTGTNNTKSLEFNFIRILFNFSLSQS